MQTTTIGALVCLLLASGCNSTPQGSFEKFVRAEFAKDPETRTNVRFDVSKTSSLTTPYRGTVSYRTTSKQQTVDEPGMYNGCKFTQVLDYEWVYLGDGQNWQKSEAYMTIQSTDVQYDPTGGRAQRVLNEDLPHRVRLF